MTRALQAMHEFLPEPTECNAGSITAACAFGYIDWRKQVDWRAINPALVTWFDAFQKNFPEFAKTHPEG